MLIQTLDKRTILPFCRAIEIHPSEAGSGWP